MIFFIWQNQLLQWNNWKIVLKIIINKLIIGQTQLKYRTINIPINISILFSYILFHHFIIIKIMTL